MAGNVSSDLKKDNTYNLKFTLSDGSVIDAGNIVAPQGEKGDKGDKGDAGITPNITSSATVDNTVGTPTVIVTKGGTAANPVFTFAFSGIKGNQGVQGDTGSQGPQGPQGPKGDPFTISKVYDSVAAMNAGYATDGVPIGGFVLIDTGNVADEDNAKLYVKGDTSYTYLTDLSGAQGMKGEKGDTGATPDVSCTASVNTSVGTPSVTVTKSGTTASPSFAFSFKNLKGEQGVQGIQGVSVVGATLTEIKYKGGVMADNVYNLKFTLSNGDVIDAGQITAPQGPKGDKGDSATIDANTLLALLLGSNGIVIAKNAAGDKVEVKIPNGINISNSLGTAQLSPQTISLFFNSENVGFLIDAIAGGMYKTNGSEQQSYLHQGNVKTLFGNQSIYGSGNIDLYRHNVKLTAVVNSKTICECVFTVVSSSNTAIDSLTDLFSVLKPIVGSDSVYPINGCMYYTNNNKYYTATRIYPTTDGGIIANGPDEERWFKWPELGTLTFYDKVTTV